MASTISEVMFSESEQTMHVFVVGAAVNRSGLFFEVQQHSPTQKQVPSNTSPGLLGFWFSRPRNPLNTCFTEDTNEVLSGFEEFEMLSEELHISFI